MNPGRDAEPGTRDAPHGYRPWPNSGRDEPASVPRFRRPSILDSMLEKIRSRQAIVVEFGAGRSIAGADVIVVRGPTRRAAQLVARQLQRGQLVVLESTMVKMRQEFVSRLRKTKKAFLLAWMTSKGVDGLDDDSCRAAEALYAGRA